MAKYIDFKFLNQSPTGKTKIWEVLTKEERPITLGSVKWFGRWRAYAFHPEHDTLFEKSCLRDIADFCEYETINHRRQKLI